MASSYGKKLKFTIFGQSHADAIGVTIEGLPAGLKIDTEELQAFLARRAPGGKLSTKRKEPDIAEFLCGIADGVTCGTPITAVIYNKDTRSGDYKNIMELPRPGHADYPAWVKYEGKNDVAGGGHFSGRMTAPLCIVGGICLQLLKQQGIEICAHIANIGSAKDSRFDPVCLTPQKLHGKSIPVIDEEAEERMLHIVEEAAQRGNSVGGSIECAAWGLPVGLGEHMFDGMENRISQAVFGIPAVKGIEFGAGFEVCEMYGNENNDAYCLQDGVIRTETNNHGGILGGMTTGMPLIFRAAFKPTPSIYMPQKSVNLSEMKEETLVIKGRHDPCILLRAVPCVEAAAAAAIYDALLESYDKGE